MNLIAVDIGNTNIKAAEFKDISLIKKHIFNNLSQLKNFLNQFTSLEYKFAICSVNPETEKKFSSFLISKKIKPFFINSISKFSFKIKYKSINTLGFDRICGLEGASFLSKRKLKNFITIDLGTATTINVVENNIFIGGLIAPGISIMIKSLYSSTAKLPIVNISSYKNFIGNDTATSIQSGIINSTVGLIEHVIKKLKKELEITKIFITGGNAEFILPHLTFKNIFNPNLVYYGMMSAYRLNNEK